MDCVRRARSALGDTQEQFAHRIGTSQSRVSDWENAETLKLSTLERIRDKTGVTLSYMLGTSDDPFREPLEGPIYQRPLLGRIAAGTPREALEQVNETHWVSSDLYKAHPHGVWLQVSGNSMNKLFPDEALVYVDIDAEVHDGEVAVVFVNGDDATVKRIYWEDNSIRLCPESYDHDYRDRVIFANDPDAPDVRVLGKVVSYTAPDRWKA